MNGQTRSWNALQAGLTKFGSLMMHTSTSITQLSTTTTSSGELKQRRRSRRKATGLVSKNK